MIKDGGETTYNLAFCVCLPGEPLRKGLHNQVDVRQNKHNVVIVFDPYPMLPHPSEGFGGRQHPNLGGSGVAAPHGT